MLKTSLPGCSRRSIKVVAGELAGPPQCAVQNPAVHRGSERGPQAGPFAQAQNRRLDERPALETDLSVPATHQELDLFYSIWAEELLKSAVQSLLCGVRGAKHDMSRCGGVGQ
jgi:hypothetical protein